MGFLTTMERRGPDGGVAHTLQVTPDNFVRAETDMQFMAVVKRGGFGRLAHERELTPGGVHSTPWAEGDILRSRGVFDLELGPVEITLPQAGARFMSLEALDEDHYTLAMFHGPGTFTFSFDNVSTRYVMIVVRVSVEPANRADLVNAHAVQDAIVVSRQGGGRFVIPNWDPVSQAKVRVALQLLGNTLADDGRTFGARGEVDPVRHLIGTATHWDRSPPRDIAYLLHVPRHNDGHTVHRLTVGQVPVDGFWSLGVYDSHGHLFADAPAGRTVNSLTATRSPDGSITVQFGGCEPGTTNCLQIERGWCYLLRLYRPRAELLAGKWKFPEAEPVRAPTALGVS